MGGRFFLPHTAREKNPNVHERLRGKNGDVWRRNRENAQKERERRTRREGI